MRRKFLLILAYLCVAVVVTAVAFVAGRIHRIFDPPMERTDYAPGGGGQKSPP